jgi:uncharacterized damage-inducible protein DinB
MIELEMINEHWERIRAVTLQFLDLLSEDELNWRPEPEAFTCGQQLLHIALTEDYYSSGVFGGEWWDKTRLRLPKQSPRTDELRRYFAEVRERSKVHLASLGPADLDRATPFPNGPADLPLRWWLWFILEHEVHHKAQLSVYFRLLGKLAPFFASVLPPGERPDIRIRAEIGDA